MPKLFIASRFRGLQLAVTRLIKAEIADSWSGGGDPADIPHIEAELKKARNNYFTQLKKLSDGQANQASSRRDDQRDHARPANNQAADQPIDKS